jgi:predicted nucleic acid-binding protein
MQADILLMDEHIGRRCARLMNLRVVGVLGTLIAAKQPWLDRGGPSIDGAASAESRFPHQ